MTTILLPTNLVWHILEFSGHGVIRNGDFIFIQKLSKMDERYERLKYKLRHKRPIPSLNGVYTAILPFQTNPNKTFLLMVRYNNSCTTFELTLIETRFDLRTQLFRSVMRHYPEGTIERQDAVQGPTICHCMH
jgi:hypothetical protein